MGDRFVSAKEIEEQKALRQQEWEKVRKPEDPALVPEEEVDNRPLYARLKEQKDKIELEKYEAKQFKNQFRGLEEEEVHFLDVVDDLKEKQLTNRKTEEKQLIEQMRLEQEQQDVQAASSSFPLLASSSKAAPKKSSGNQSKVSKQAALLGVAIKRKSNVLDEAGKNEPTEKKPVSAMDRLDTKDGGHSNANGHAAVRVESRSALPSASYTTAIRPSATNSGLTRLPSALVGYGAHDSDSSNDSDDDSNSDTSDKETSGSAQPSTNQNATCKDKCSNATPAK